MKQPQGDEIKRRHGGWMKRTRNGNRVPYAPLLFLEFAMERTHGEKPLAVLIRDTNAKKKLTRIETKSLLFVGLFLSS